MTLRHLPWLLASGRLAAGFVLVALAWWRFPPWLLAAIFLLGFLSDIFDGIIARRLGVSTLALRRFDTRADLVFLIGTAGALVIQAPSIARDWTPWIFCYAALFLLRNLVDFLRCRASSSYHMWSGKIWSLVLGLYLFLSLAGHHPAALIPIAFAIYALNALEGIAASLLLPRPMADIPSLWHVFVVRRE